MPASIGNVTLHMGPTQVGGPDNLENPIVQFVEAARDDLLVAVQELEAQPIAAALTRAQARGVAVRLILERKYLRADNPPADPFGPGGDNDTNRDLLAAALRAGIDVAIDLNPETFHQKFIVRDPDRGSPHAAVLTGSTNFTPTGLNENLNHVVVVNSKRVAGVYRDEFDEMWSGTFGRLRERRDREPAAYQVSGIRVKVLFAPDHMPEGEIMKQMLKAQQRIDFAVFTFSDTSGIDDTMKVLDQAGIIVRGILDQGQGNQSWSASHNLVGPTAHPGSNIQLHLSQNVGPLNKLHHKLMVIDRRVVIAGSFNFTRPATKLNDENIIVIGDLEETDPQAIANQQVIADYAFNEITRMISQNAGPPL